MRAEVRWSAVFPAADGESASAAFVVGDGRHVVTVALSEARAESGRLRADQRLLPAESFVDPVSRIVVFRLDGPPGRAVALSSEAPVAAVRALGGGWGKCTGWVKRIEGKILPLALLNIDYAGKAPQPGTPLTDASGGVVAVAHQSTGPRSGYAIPAAAVKRVVEDVLRGGRVARGWIGLRLHPDALLPEVTRVQEGSPSALAGLRAGDVLLEIGSRPLGEYADAVNAFFFLRPGVGMPIKFKRGQQKFVVTLTPVERRRE